MAFEASFVTDIGKKRKQNQDSGYVSIEDGFFAVADGMGGHQGGEIASRMVIEHMQAAVHAARKSPDWNSIDLRSFLAGVISDANAEIFKQSVADPVLQGMGTTAVAVLIRGDQAFIANVGDSRCYLFRGARQDKNDQFDAAVWQITQDHSLVQEKLQAGLITRDQLRTDRMKNVITRSIGFEATVKVDVWTKRIESGDTFLLCTDGFSGPVTDEELVRLLSQSELTLEALNRELIDRANELSGDDNVSVALMRV